jgi:hypothetical protein
MSDDDIVVAVYRDHASAEDAVKQLQKSGYDIRQLSIVVKDYRIEERVVGFYSTSDRVKHWGVCGVLWGGTLGLLFGVALIVFPDLGPGLIAEPLAVWIRGALGGAITIGGLCAGAAGINSVRLPKDSVLKFELAIEKDDEFLLVAHGTADEAAVARDILWAARPT